jgi:hypothetical protein
MCQPDALLPEQGIVIPLGRALFARRSSVSTYQHARTGGKDVGAEITIAP